MISRPLKHRVVIIVVDYSHQQVRSRGEGVAGGVVCGSDGQIVGGDQLTVER